MVRNWSNWNFAIFLLWLSLTGLYACNTSGNQHSEMGQLPIDQVIFRQENFREAQPSASKPDLSPIAGMLKDSLGITEWGAGVPLDSTIGYLIPLGKWEKQKEFGQVQGKHFQEGNQFYPNPLRAFQWSFEGNFKGFLVANASLKKVRPVGLAAAGDSPIRDFRIVFAPLGEEAHYWVVVRQFLQGNAGPVRLRVYHLNDGMEVDNPAGSAEVLDWSYVQPRKTVVAMVRQASGEIGSVEIPLAEISAEGGQE